MLEIVLTILHSVRSEKSKALRFWSRQVSPPLYPSIDLDAQTESNHDTALTLACAGGHAELVSLLLSRGADIEHRDKKGACVLTCVQAGQTLQCPPCVSDPDVPNSFICAETAN